MPIPTINDVALSGPAAAKAKADTDTAAKADAEGDLRTRKHGALQREDWD
jgi:hypothetical protein